MIRLLPLHDRVLIRPLPPEELSRGGLLIPESAKERPTIGDILAVGPGRVTEAGVLIPPPVEFAEGVRVLYTKFAGAPADLDGEELVLVRVSDILGVVKLKLD